MEKMVIHHIDIATQHYFKKPIVSTQEIDKRIIQLSLHPPKILNEISSLEGLCTEMSLISPLWDPVDMYSSFDRDAKNRSMIFFFQAIAKQHLYPTQTFIKVHSISNVARQMLPEVDAELVARQMKFFLRRLRYLKSDLVEKLNLVKPSDVVELDFTGFGLRFIPIEIGLFENLRTLKLAGNELESLPHSMGDLKNLEYLDLSGNPRLETITSIAECSALKFLNITNTYITHRLDDLKDVRIVE
jgi:Leucine-rich repeat (LRR) protein